VNHKRGKPKDARSGCLLCKPWKSNAYKSADRAKTKRAAFAHERNAW